MFITWHVLPCTIGSIELDSDKSHKTFFFCFSVITWKFYPSLRPYAMWICIQDNNRDKEKTKLSRKSSWWRDSVFIRGYPMIRVSGMRCLKECGSCCVHRFQSLLYGCVSVKSGKMRTGLFNSLYVVSSQWSAEKKIKVTPVYQSNTILYSPLPRRHISNKGSQGLKVFGQVCFPLIQVLRTTPCLSSTTKSAWAPGRKVPFIFSIPKHLFHRWINNHNSVL